MHLRKPTGAVVKKARTASGPEAFLAICHGPPGTATAIPVMKIKVAWNGSPQASVQMDPATRVSGKAVLGKGKVNLSWLMVALMKDASKMGNLMVLAASKALMVVFIKANGGREEHMERASIPKLRVLAHMKVNGSRTSAQA